MSDNSRWDAGLRIIMAMWWRRALDGLLVCIFSSPCPGCGSGGEGGRLCADCLAHLPRLARESLCVVCSEPLGSGLAGREHAGQRCGVCLDGRAFARAVALGGHHGELKDWIHAIKFGGRRSLATGLGTAAAGEWAGELGQVDAVVPVPLGTRRARERGYNQAEQIARGVATALAVPLQPRWLRRSRETATQTGLSQAQRRENVRGAFAASPAVAGRRVLLVDDVMTTGATLEEAARALRRAGAGEVVVLVLSRAGRELPRDTESDQQALA